jgi:hypothetical protein
MRKSSLIFAGLALAALAGRSGAESLIINGDFETGDFDGWTLTGMPTYSMVSDFTGGGSGAYSGSDYAMLGSFGVLSYLSQDVATTPGTAYDLSYYLASDGGTPSEFSVAENGTTLSDKTNLPKSGYVEQNFDFVASADVTDIKFGSRDDPGYLSLDDVSLAPVGTVAQSAAPIPSPFWGAALGMAGLAASKLMRRRLV